jgi:hypothetical protein
VGISGTGIGMHIMRVRRKGGEGEMETSIVTVRTISKEGGMGMGGGRGVMG